MYVVVGYVDEFVFDELGWLDNFNVEFIFDKVCGSI